MVQRLRTMGHILERTPGNVMSGLRPPSTTTTHMLGATEGYPSEQPLLLGEEAPAPQGNLFGGGG